MRLVLPLLCLASSAAAWEFRPDPICTLDHVGEAAQVTVTFDAALPEYAIALTLAEGTWPDAAFFAITFSGARELTIRTTQHVLSDGGRTLTVRDRGFDNVLDGLQFYQLAIARAGGLTVMADLTGAAPQVEAFRACPAPGLS